MTYTERDLINDLESILDKLGAPVGSDGGFVPSDNNDPAQLAQFINSRLTKVHYYDGEAPLDGPFLMTPFRPWYDNILYSPCGSEAQGAHVNLLLQWPTESGVVSDLLPPYPGKARGWRWNNVMLGSQWVVDVWLGQGVVCAQPQ